MQLLACSATRSPAAGLVGEHRRPVQLHPVVLIEKPIAVVETEIFATVLVPQLLSLFDGGGAGTLVVQHRQPQPGAALLRVEQIPIPQAAIRVGDTSCP